MRPTLEQAVAAIRAGDKKTGRALLADIIQADWDNEMAWLWLSSVLETDDEKRRCLKRVLEINPDNQAAQRGLALLGPDPSPRAILSPPEDNDELPPAEDEVQELPAATSPVSLAERLALASRVPADIDTELLERLEAEPADEAKRDSVEDEEVLPSAAERPEAEREPESSEAVPVTVGVDDSSSAGYVGDETAIEDDAEQGGTDEVESADADEDETEAGPKLSFWQTGRSTLVLAGLVVLLLVCAACVTVILVFNSYRVQPLTTAETLMESPIPTSTSPPPEIPAAASVPTSTPLPTMAASPTSTAVVPDTPTPTPTLVRTATPIRNAEVVQVINVIAADEIEVVSNGETVRVKYLSIAVPAFNDAQRGTEPFGLEALASNQSLVQGQTVQLERDRINTDDEGRLLRYVYVGDRQVNEELVRQGLARVELVPPNTKYGARLQEAEQDARMNRRGLWSLE